MGGVQNESAQGAGGGVGVAGFLHLNLNDVGAQKNHLNEAVLSKT